MSPSTLGGLYKVDGNRVALDVAAQPTFDKSKMSATTVINTAAIDRDGEVILPTGVQLENYRRNPVVLWNHGFGQIDFPIAKCEHPSGELALKVSDEEIQATSYFAQRIKEAEQIFDLITQRIVRAASINVMPLSMRPHVVDGMEIRVIDESDMGEWSWVHVGANPEAVSKILTKNRLAGSAIVEPIRKSLRQLLPAKTVLGKGAEFQRIERAQKICDDIIRHLDNIARARTNN